MKIRLSELRRLIREEIEGEAPEDSPLGRFAFPKYRRGLPPEPDTPLEVKLFNALEDHVVRNSKLNAKEAMWIEDLLAKGLYPSVFSPPDSSEVFRGMKVSRQWLAKFLGVAGAAQVPKSGEREVDTVFKPKNGGGSSWTMDDAISNRFSTKRSVLKTPGSVSVTLCAKVADNPNKFVTGPGHLYQLDYIAGFSDEAEVIGLGDINVYKIVWKPLPVE